MRFVDLFDLCRFQRLCPVVYACWRVQSICCIYMYVCIYVCIYKERTRGM